MEKNIPYLSNKFHIKDIKIEDHYFYITLKNIVLKNSDFRFIPHRIEITPIFSIYSFGKIYYRLNLYGGIIEMNGNFSKLLKGNSINKKIQNYIDELFNRRIKIFYIENCNLFTIKNGRKYKFYLQSTPDYLKLNLRYKKSSLSYNLLKNSDFLINFKKFNIIQFFSDSEKKLIPIKFKKIDYTGNFSSKKSDCNGTLKLIMKSSFENITSLKSRVYFKKSRLYFKPDNNTSKMDGYIDFKEKKINLKINCNEFDISLLKQLMNNENKIFSDYTLSGVGSLDFKLFGKINHLDKIGFINIENGIICSRNNHDCIKNVSGELSFTNRELSIENLKGNILKTPLSINGKITQLDKKPKINLNFKIEEVSIDKLKSNFKRFGHKIGDYFSTGRSNLNLKIIKKNGKTSVSGTGDFNGCKIILAPELLELKQVTGKFKIENGKVILKEFFGMWGNIPFNGNGKIGENIHNQFKFTLNFSKFTQSDFDFFIKSSLSRLNFSDESNGTINISSIDNKLFINILFMLKKISLNLYPLPLNINLSKINGKLKFISKDSEIKFDSGRIDYNSYINCKFKIPYFKSIPVTLEGKSEGKMIFNESETSEISFDGNLKISDGELKLIDNGYSSKKIFFNKLNLTYDYIKNNLNFKSSIYLLDGVINMFGLVKYNFKNYFRMNFNIINLSLNKFYEYNKQCHKIFNGNLIGSIFCEKREKKFVLRSKIKAKNGSLRNIFMIQNIFNSVLDNKIYYLPFDELSLSIWSDGKLFKIRKVLINSTNDELKELAKNLKREFNITNRGKLIEFKNKIKNFFNKIKNNKSLWRLPYEKK